MNPPSFSTNRQAKAKCPVKGCTVWFFKKNTRSLDIHLYTHHACPTCSKMFLRPSRHVCKGRPPSSKQSTSGECRYCQRFYHRLNRHQCKKKSQFGTGDSQPDFGLFTEQQSTQEGVINTFRYVNKDETLLDYDKFWEILYGSIADTLEYFLKVQKGLRVQFTLHALMENPVNDEQRSAFLNTGYITLIHPDDIPDLILTGSEYLSNAMACYTNRGSGFTVKKLQYFELTLAKYKPLKGRGWLGPPDYLKFRHGLVFIPSEKNDCFKYAFLSSLHASEIPVHGLKREKKSYKPFLKDYNFRSLKYPVRLSNLTKFEQDNDNLAVNVFSLEEERKLNKKKETVIFPVRISKSKGTKVANLLLITDPCHFVGITDFSRLIGRQGQRRRFICYRCMNCFSTKQSFTFHSKLCIGFEATRIDLMPRMKNGEIQQLKFREWEKTVPFTHYAICDFEAISKPVQGGRGKGTTFLRKFDPLGVGILFVSGERLKYYQYWGPRAAEWFIEKALDLADEALEEINQEDDGLETDEFEEEEFARQRECDLCGAVFGSLDPDGNEIVAVRHHIHRHIYNDDSYSPGLNRIVCSRCNLLLKPKQHINFLFHNSSFDQKLILSAVKIRPVREVDVFGKTTESFQSVMINKKVRILDTCCKLGMASLDALVNSAKAQNGPQFFEAVRKAFPYLSDEDFESILSKLIFPYDLIDSWDTLISMQGVPNKEQFYNLLDESHATDEQYSQFLKAYELLKCKTMYEYYQKYLQFDCYLLYQVYKQYRITCLQTYNIDPDHFLSGASVSWNAMLISTKVSLDYVYSPLLFTLLRSSLYGGITLANRKYTKANIPGKEGYDENKPGLALYYLDVLGLYSFIQLNDLPSSNFEQLTNREIAGLTENDCAELKRQRSDKTEYILCIDCHTPPELQDLLIDLPFFPSRGYVTHSDISEFQTKTLNQNFDSGIPTAQRLLLSFHPLKQYGVYSPYLRLALLMGCVVTKVHYGFKCKVAPVFRPYIEKNVKLRAQTNCQVARTFYKNCCNLIFGMSIYSVFDKADIKIAKTPRQVEKYIAKPTFKSLEQLDDNVTLIALKKPRVIYNFPYFIGWGTLFESKRHLMELYYFKIKLDLFRNRSVSALYIDTDSIIVAVTLEEGETDVYNLMQSRTDFLDNSVYKPNHPCYNEESHGIPGHLKNELPDYNIKEIICLSPKCYAIRLYEDSTDYLKLKGVKKYVRNQMTFLNYKRVLEENGCEVVEMNVIQSLNHQMYVLRIRKRGLSALSLKQYQANKYDNVPYGYHKVLENQSLATVRPHLD